MQSGLKFLHELPDIKSLFLVVSNEKNLLPAIVEKDYWIMHTLWGLQQQGFNFELKGGTSLSKGFAIIERFIEDIDLKIYPASSENVKIGKNQDKVSHIESRRSFFNSLCSKLLIEGLSF
jgi:predicted nucleotidyltransferase component of viral defense system